MANQNLNNQNISPVLNIKEIKDQYIRKNFSNLNDYFRSQNQLLDFKFFQQTFTAAVSNYKIAHGFKFIPQDLLVTQLVGANATFNFDSFDSKNIDVSVDGPCVLRFFLGSYQTSNAQPTNNVKGSMFFFGSSSSDIASASSKDQSVRTLNAGADLALTDGTVFLSGASANYNLPTAKGNKGKVLKIVHAGISLMQGYSLIPFGSEKIIPTNGTGAFTLWTLGEMAEITSDGTDWRVTDRYTLSGPNTYPLVIGAVTRAPAYPNASTGYTQLASWGRSGKMGTIIYSYKGPATPTGASTGAGFYLFPTPNGMALDTRLQPTSTNALFSAGYCNVAPGTNPAGGSPWLRGNASFYNATNLILLRSSTDAGHEIPAGFVAASDSQSALSSANTNYSFQVTFPVEGWQP